MMSRVAALATIALVGIIIADVLIHPKGTGVALAGMNRLAKTTGNQMLGYKAA